MGGRTIPTKCPHGKGGLEDAGYPAGGCLDCRYEMKTRNLVRAYPTEAVAQLVADGVLPLTFEEVAVINVQRCRRWHDGFPDGEDAWTGADWSNAMMGEAGEAANVVKKLRRIETGARGAVDPERERLVEMLGDELADTFIYLQLLAAFYGVDLPAAIVRKFNAISEREGLPERLRDGTYRLVLDEGKGTRWVPCVGEGSDPAQESDGYVGQCRVCGDWVTLTTDGRVADHEREEADSDGE